MEGRGLTVKGGKGDDIIHTFRSTPSSSSNFLADLPVLLGGQGADTFACMRPAGARIGDYKKGKDMIDVGNYHPAQIASKVIDGDLHLFRRRGMEILFVVEEVSSIKDITFVNGTIELG